MYHADRLNYPRKRIGEKGGGKWQTIPWDQAFDEIAAKLAALKQQYGAETLAFTGDAEPADDATLLVLRWNGVTGAVSAR